VPEYKEKPKLAPELHVKEGEPTFSIQRASQRVVEFKTVGQPSDVALVPFHSIFDERYAIYWRLST
jgi:hypothetical protein